MALTKVTSGGLTDDSIVNADINSSAAVALSKLATDPSNASNLASGTVPTARLGSGTASASTFLTGAQTYAGAGITECDQWRMTAETAMGSGSSYITANWERNDSTVFEKMGTGLSESSGVFSFPSTGKYLISFQLNLSNRNGGTNRTMGYVRNEISVTINDSAYTKSTETNASFDDSGNEWTNSCFAQFFFDVTDVANCKFKVGLTAADSCAILGGSTYQGTAITVTRLGDT